LAVSIKANTNLVSLGTSLTYTITVTNLSATAATGVFLTNTVPSEAAFVSANTSVGGFVQSGGIVVAGFGPLAAGATAVLSVVATPTNAAVLIARANVASAEPDSNPANNVAFTATTVTNPAPALVDLGISLTAAPNPVIAGEPLAFSLTITNNSASVASAVFVTNTLPPNVNLVSVLPSQGTATTNVGIIIVSLGSVSNSNPATIAIVVVPQAAGALTNLVNVTGLEADSTNNSASAVVTVVGAQGSNWS
jgi:uncharacterized repeat protein (TIGR01451 family)